MIPRTMLSYLYVGITWGVLSFVCCLLALKMWRFALNQPRGAGKPKCMKCGKEVQSVTVLSEDLQVCDDCWEERMKEWRGATWR